MIEKDIIIEELKEQRWWRGVFVAIAFTLGSWLVSNIENYKNYKFILGMIFEISVIIKVFFINKNIKNMIKKLKEIR